MEDKLNWFNDEMGYGYVEYKENGNVFIHISNGDSFKEFELIKNGDNYSLKDRD